MLNKLLLLFLIILTTTYNEASMYRGNEFQLRYHTSHVRFMNENGVKFSVIGNLMVITCDDNGTLAQLPNTFTTHSIINHLKFVDCFRNKSNLLNSTVNNNEFNLNQFINNYNLKLNAVQLTLEFNEMSEINVNRLFVNFKFNSFKDLRLINVNFLNQTLLGLFGTTTKLSLLNNYQIDLNYFQTENTIEFLTVHDNNVKGFSLGRFKHLLSLEMVDCDINFNEFNIRNFFEKNHRLVSLHMEQNFWSNERIELSENLFNGLSKLKFLQFSRENLFELPVGIFRDLASLIQLNLAHNRLEYLPKEILYNNEILEAIDLSHNNLKEITDLHFSKTPYLIHMIVSYNSLETLQYNASLQNSIQVMDFSNNNIEFTNSSRCPIITAPAQYLQINLAYNRINNFKSVECLINDHNVQLLNMSGNLLTEFNLTQLSTNVMQHKTMAQLIMSNNQITNVDVLETFDWDGYEVIHAFSNLIVDLDRNPVLCDNCTMLKNMYAREFVNIYYNDIVVRFIHPHYCRITSFCDVQQYHQFVYSCPTGCSCSYNEFILNFRINCSNSNLTVVPQIPYPPFIFSEVELILDNNMIENFTLDYQHYDVSTKIIKISIRNNSLVEFTLAYEKYPLNLVELKLDQNKLNSFSNETLSILNIAEDSLNVTLSGNLFCNNQTYYEYFINSYRFNLIDDISCYKIVETLKITSYNPRKITISNLAIVMITAISIIVVIGVIAVLLVVKVKSKVVVLRSRFINHKPLNGENTDMGEELLGEDEM